jgi:hypothetical protein
MKLSIRRLANGEGLPLPAYASDGAAGLDLYAALPAGQKLVLEPGARDLISTGIQIALPEGYEAQLRPRSGLAVEYGVTVLNAPGTPPKFHGEQLALRDTNGRSVGQLSVKVRAFDALRLVGEDGALADGPPKRIEDLSRDELIAALRELFLDRMEAAAEASIAETDPRAAVVVFIEAIMRAVAQTCTLNEATPPEDAAEGRGHEAINQAITAFIDRARETDRLQPGVDAAWAFTVGKALDGLFHYMAVEENAIRTNPAARTTDLLKKVFS